MYDLKTYLRNIYELEASIYQQTQHITSIQSRISRLPQKPNEDQIKHESKSSLTLGIGMTIAGALAGVSGVSLMDSYEFFLGLLGLALLIGAGFLLFWGVPILLGGLFGSASDQKNYTRLLANYEKGLIVKHALETDLPTLRNKLSSTRVLLRSYYLRGILHPKYRNFVAVSYLLDCIDTGRCTQLDGPNGAYNQYELEVRMDRISSQLDTVIDKLDQIRQNQYSLYAAITQSNRINEQMNQKLDKYCQNLENLNSSSEEIRKSLNTANHIAELTRKEISYRNYLDRGSRYSN